MQTLDLIIVFGYLIGITIFGSLFASRQETTEDYFVGGRRVPWWAAAASIAASETSTITFISLPGIAFAKNGNFQFLQLAFGYLIGRAAVSLLFVPWYFRGELLTVYQLLERRFGGKIRMLTAALFVAQRNVADGIRLLLTAIILAAVYTAFQPTASPAVVTVVSIILLGVVMIIFTYYGGIEAVIWVEVVQFGVYIAGAIAATVVIANHTPDGFLGAIRIGRQFDKFALFDFSINFTKTYTIWAGLIGGCFLTMSTHGTDHYLVQRYLCTNKPRKASLALLTSGATVFAQSVGFLFIGVLLFAFYQPFSNNGYADAKTNSAFPFTGGDKVFPDFIAQQMPAGLAGLLVAAIFAAALSSSLNSVAAVFINDLYKPLRPHTTDNDLLRLSQISTLAFGIAQIAVALLIQNQTESALNQALSIASIINGPILGVFLVGVLFKTVREPAALIGMLGGAILMLYIYFGTKIAWTWYAVLGSLTTLLLARLAALFMSRESGESGES